MRNQALQSLPGAANESAGKAAPTLRVEKVLHEKMKAIALLHERASIMALTSRVLNDYCDQYETASGGLLDVSPLDEAIRPEQQTTVRVANDQLVDRLRSIAFNESTTIMAITQRVLTDYCDQYEAALGQPLLRRPKSNLGRG